jgi:hypothetical protein
VGRLRRAAAGAARSPYAAVDVGEAKLAGLTEGQAAVLATQLLPEDVIDVCELVEAGCRPTVAVRIVL